MLVYLMNMAGTDYYKIGYTSRPIAKRLSEVQVGCPGVIKVIRTFESDIAPQIENTLHHKLDMFRSSGEWFELSLDDVHRFESMCFSIEKGIKILKEMDNPFINKKSL